MAGKKHFGPAHLGAIALTFTTPLVLCAISRLYDSGSARGIISWSFVTLLVGGEIFRLILLRRDGQLTGADATLRLGSDHWGDHAGLSEPVDI
jgi:hypothetical protein